MEQKSYKVFTHKRNSKYFLQVVFATHAHKVVFSTGARGHCKWMSPLFSDSNTLVQKFNTKTASCNMSRIPY